MGHLHKTGKSWSLAVMKDGKRKSIPLGVDFKQAVILQASIEAALSDAKFKKQLARVLSALGLFEPPDVSDETPIPWPAARATILRHLRGVGLVPRTIEIIQEGLDDMESILKPSFLSDVTPEKADEWVTSLRRRLSKQDPTGTTRLSDARTRILIRSVRSCFSRFFRWRLIDSNPFVRCDMPKPEKTLPRPLSDEYLKKLLNACAPALRRCVTILAESGMRLNEFFHLPWKRVRLGSKPCIHIRRDRDDSQEDRWYPKAHTERIIPCSPELVSALGPPGKPEELVCGKNDRGYPVSKDWIERSFRRALKRAGLEEHGFALRSLKDTYAARLAKEGYEAYAIAARLGYSRLVSSLKYTSMPSS